MHLDANWMSKLRRVIPGVPGSAGPCAGGPSAIVRDSGVMSVTLAGFQAARTSGHSVKSCEATSHFEALEGSIVRDIA